MEHWFYSADETRIAVLFLLCHRIPKATKLRCILNRCRGWVRTVSKFSFSREFGFDQRMEAVVVKI